MAFSLGGLASGIDTQSIVDSLVSVGQRPIDALAKKQASIDSASSTISSLSARLSALKAAALALSTNTGFSSFTATSSDAGVVASAAGNAAVGSYAVQVSALARGQKSRGSGVGPSDTPLGMDGTLSITVGAGTAVDVTIAGTDTLADVASKITASGARVAASLMNDGSGYRLIVQGLDSGAANGVTFSEGGSIALGLTTYESAQDAAFTVDGMPVTSPTNQVTGVLAGVKLALTKVTLSPATVQVSSDSGALKTKISAFVAAYNDIINAGHQIAGFGGQKAQNAVLAADPAVRTTLRKIGTLVNGLVPNTTGTYTTLRSIGITAKNDGTLAFDSAKLETVLALDPSSVRRLFVTDSVTGATGVMKSVMDGIDALVTGTSAPIQARINGLAAQSKRLAVEQDKMAARLSAYQAQLKKQFATMDDLVGKYKSMGSALNSSITNLDGSLASKKSG